MRKFFNGLMVGGTVTVALATAGLLLVIAFIVLIGVVYPAIGTNVFMAAGFLIFVIALSVVLGKRDYDSKNR